MDKDYKLDLLCRAVFCLIIFQMLILFSLIHLFLGDTIYYKDDKIVSKVKPEYLDGLLKIYYTEEPFPFLALGEGGHLREKTALGIYVPGLRTIKLSLEHGMPMEELLAHELAHHQWFTKLSKNEKKQWQKKFETFKKDNLQDSVPNVQEFYAEYWEDRWQEFYVNAS